MSTTIDKVSAVFIFVEENGYSVLIDDFEDGYAKIVVPVSVIKVDDKTVITMTNRDDFVAFIHGCFDEESNFKEMLFKAFDCPFDTEFIGIKMVIGEMEKTITMENYTFFHVWESLNELVDEYSDELCKKLNEEGNAYNAKLEELYDLMENLDIEFKSDSAEDAYLIESDKAENEDEDAVVYGESFVAYVQYLVEHDGASVKEAVDETYNTFEYFEMNIPGASEGLQLICKYCKYGDEIYQSYIEFLMSLFNGEMGYL